ncbi:MAG: SIMPL domain-containing protein [Anaerolineae bacterium]|nr:SIMPL domain-containing protein [Anaerolineae bacterium]
MSTKKNLLLLVTLLLAVSTLWIGAPSANAQGDAAMRTITVTGYGAAYGAPDIVMLGLGVEAVNVDIKAAMDDTTARMNAVMLALQDNGVAVEDIRTEHFSIWQDYGYGPMEPGMQGDASYRVSTSVTITVRNVARVGDLLALAVDAGANIVNYIQFDIEDRAVLQAEARGSAVADAQARAEHLAGLLGMAVGEPLEIIEGGDFYGPMPMGGGGGGIGFAEAAPIGEGQLSVNMQVTITFALVPAN